MATDTTGDTTDRPDTFYTPWRIRQLLRDYPALLDRSTPDETERGGPKRVLHSWWPLENAACIKADLDRAIEGLEWFPRLCIHKRFVEGHTIRHIAVVLGCDRDTVSHQLHVGTEAMARALGWAGPAGSWRPRVVERVYRSPRLTGDV